MPVVLNSKFPGIKAVLLLSAVLAASSCATVAHYSHTLQVKALSAPLPHDKTGQLDTFFPELDSRRAQVNNRRGFMAYQGQGELLLDLQTATAVSLQINGHPLVLTPRAELGQHLSVDISAYTRNGFNQLEVTGVQPLGARVRLAIPYPALTESTPEAVGFSAARLNKIDDLINREVEQGFPGAVLVIVKDGRIIKETAYGFALRYAQDGTELTTPQPMQTDTIFDLASNSKMYATNYALMKLVSEGRLDINKPLQHYIPEYQGDGRELILVSDLLYHMAGYAPEVHFHRPDNTLGPEFYSLNREHTIGLLLRKVPLSRARGEASVYSDIDYMLLGILIERISGLPQDQYLEQQLYRPMGLQQTMFNPLLKGVNINRIAATELSGNSRGGRVSFPANRPDVVRGEVHDEKAFHALEGVAGHAGLFSTAREVAQLAALALHGGYGTQTVFTPAVIQQFTRPSTYDHTFGLGWRTAVQGNLNWHFGAYASPYAFGHTGWTGTVTVIDPYYGLTIVLLTNKKHSPVIADGDESYYFAGDRFETGMYGSVITKIYEAMF
ncbi:penicillin binding protein PBP4B [Chromatiaceae bacterium AAb-1]|nr:penicillin binding protein PBP4B [Chromatiaceae bacterium AAb-1]